MSAADLDALRSERERLQAEVLDLQQRVARAEEEAFVARCRRLTQEADPADASGAHVAGFVRDLARALEDALAMRSRALREARDLALRVERASARGWALTALLGRLARSLPAGEPR